MAADAQTSAARQFETLQHDIVDGILTVTLNRPDHLNAFTVTMADELEATFITVNDDDAVKAVIVTGAGRAFCAGMDLDSPGNVFGLDDTQRPSLADMDDLATLPDGIRDTGGRVTLAIFNCAKPVIGAINGAAVGIGATMTLAMDARLASTTARIGFVFGRLGITPEAESTWFLPRIVGLPKALDLVYSADVLRADDALEIGLVSAVHEPDALLEAAATLARRYTSGRSPVATALARQMLYRNSAQPHPVEAHRVDSLAMFYTGTAEGIEGVQAFRDKRDPDFTRTVSRDLPPFYAPWTDPEKTS
jgi:enoyl-CoA hydratase/carnithine racemase